MRAPRSHHWSQTKGTVAHLSCPQQALALIKARASAAAEHTSTTCTRGPSPLQRKPGRVQGRRGEGAQGTPREAALTLSAGTVHGQPRRPRPRAPDHTALPAPPRSSAGISPHVRGSQILVTRRSVSLYSLQTSFLLYKYGLCEMEML